MVVSEDQLSLAIGKRGQNVRLAARLTGWDIDILTPAEYNKGLDDLESTLRQVQGIDDVLVEKIMTLGLISLPDISEVGVDPLISELELDEVLAQTIVDTAAEAAKRIAQEAEVAKRIAQEEAEAAKTLAQESDAAGEADDDAAGSVDADADTDPGETDQASSDDPSAELESQEQDGVGTGEELLAPLSSTDPQAADSEGIEEPGQSVPSADEH